MTYTHEQVVDWWFEGLISAEELTGYGFKEIRSGRMVWLEYI